MFYKLVAVLGLCETVYCLINIKLEGITHLRHKLWGAFDVSGPFKTNTWIKAYDLKVLLYSQKPSE